MRRFRFQLIALALLLVAIVACGGDTSERPDASGSMRIGLLLNFVDSPETAGERERAFNLAIQHINEGGGVLG